MVIGKENWYHIKMSSGVLFLLLSPRDSIESFYIFSFTYAFNFVSKHFVHRLVRLFLSLLYFDQLQYYYLNIQVGFDNWQIFVQS